MKKLKKKKSSLKKEESDSSDLFKLLEIDAAAAVLYQLSITAGRKRIVVKSIIFKI